MKKTILLLLSHLLVGLAGFAAGIYVLPILTAPPAPPMAEVQKAARGSLFSGRFKRELEGSDTLHWGEGEVFIGREQVSLQGQVSPGPDYRLYLSPRFVETEAEFLAAKPQMTEVGNVRTFDNFIVKLPEAVDPTRFNSVIIWCETFGEFITAAQYQ